MKHVYRKISVEVWEDEKFQALSRPNPNAQTLWVWLTSCRFTVTLPGVVIGKKAVMAAELEWDLKDFEKCFAELEAKEMVVYDSRGLVWRPNALRHNRPDSPNGLKAWAKNWLQIPECPLKDRVLKEIESYAESLGKTYVDAFRKSFAEPLTKVHPSLAEGSTEASARLPTTLDLPVAVSGAVTVSGSVAGEPSTDIHQSSPNSEASSEPKPAAADVAKDVSRGTSFATRPSPAKDRLTEIHAEGLFDELCGIYVEMTNNPVFQPRTDWKKLWGFMKENPSVAPEVHKEAYRWFVEHVDSGAARRKPMSARPVYYATSGHSALAHVLKENSSGDSYDNQKAIDKLERWKREEDRESSSVSRVQGAKGARDA